MGRSDKKLDKKRTEKTIYNRFKKSKKYVKSRGNRNRKNYNRTRTRTKTLKLKNKRIYSQKRNTQVGGSFLRRKKSTPETQIKTTTFNINNFPQNITKIIPELFRRPFDHLNI